MNISNLADSGCSISEVRRMQLTLDPYSPVAVIVEQGGPNLAELVSERQRIWNKVKAELDYLGTGGVLLDEDESIEFRTNRKTLSELELKIDQEMGRNGASLR